VKNVFFFRVSYFPFFSNENPIFFSLFRSPPQLKHIKISLQTEFIKAQQAPPPCECIRYNVGWSSQNNLASDPTNSAAPYVHTHYTNGYLFEIDNCNEHSEQARAPHTNGPRDVPRCGDLSFFQKMLHYKRDRCAQASSRGAARCASQVLDRGAQANARGLGGGVQAVALSATR
jgi:hypothetical protein